MRQFKYLALSIIGIMMWGNIAQAANAADDTNMNSMAPPWEVVTPESQGMDASKMASLWRDLQAHQTTALLVLRNDKVVFEQYADGYTRTKPHGTASLAKALVGGVSLMVAMNDGRIKPDDLASRYVPQWADEPRKRDITIRQLATHTSGLEDAEAPAEPPAEDVPHAQLTGWKGDFWKYLAPPRDPFTLARDIVPVLDTPGTKERYSNPGMAMLSYCITSSLKGAPDTDLRSLLKHRIMEPLGVPASEWACGYGISTKLEDKSLVAPWGGGNYSAQAVACIGQLMLHKGMWRGRQLLAPAIVEAATSYAGMPNHAGLGWWVNHNPDGSRFWKSAPADAFWGSGAGHQFLLVVPSEHLVVVRSGNMLEPGDHSHRLEQHIVNPLMQALIPASTSVKPGATQGTSPAGSQTKVSAGNQTMPIANSLIAPYPPSPIIRRVVWAPPDTIMRWAADSDNWPLTWGDDDNLYTAYGDGPGFDPTAERLSLGLARVSGQPPNLTGSNLPVITGATPGSGARGQKASGVLMVRGVLYLLARNSGNSQLAWSKDHGLSWTWCDWKFTTSFGCPTFLNYGRNYAGAWDHYVYLYSPDTDSAYTPADSMVLARVPQDRMTQRAAYEFFQRLNAQGQPIWTQDIQGRGAVFSYPGHCLRSQITYNAALQRYLWWQQLPNLDGAKEHKDLVDTRYQGGFGVYDAPTPWGPWTTAYFTSQWDVGPGESASFPTKWMSADGKTMSLVFSGNDSFSVRKATIELSNV
ncbi:MAG: serine hydrolase, partial [Abitibacteriaceae bacterium]|nr:serine hydrolase [Abditibacteriaceae bacterium]